MKQRISRFVDHLSRLDPTPNAYNHYAAGNTGNDIRRQNLILYFSELLRTKPTIMLLGEAPGYQGCRLTGVPFCSEDILLRGIPELHLFGSDKGYRKTAEYERAHKEPTSTIMWSTLSRFSFIPVLWSAFPFHPHKPGDTRSNRAPTRDEIALGKNIFQELVDMYSIQRVIAVGNVAHASLAEVGIRANKIRHPSHGGKTDFVRGIRKLINT